MVLWAAFIFQVSSIPARDIIIIFPRQDIIFHIIEFAILAFLLNRALRVSQLKIPQRRARLVVVILVCLIYALLDELHQSLVPDRMSSIEDIISDSTGIILGTLLPQRSSHKHKNS